MLSHQRKDWQLGPSKSFLYVINHEYLGVLDKSYEISLCPFLKNSWKPESNDTTILQSIIPICPITCICPSLINGSHICGKSYGWFRMHFPKVKIISRPYLKTCIFMAHTSVTYWLPWIMDWLDFIILFYWFPAQLQAQKEDNNMQQQSELRHATTGLCCCHIKWGLGWHPRLDTWLEPHD